MARFGPFWPFLALFGPWFGRAPWRRLGSRGKLYRFFTISLPQSRVADGKGPGESPWRANGGAAWAGWGVTRGHQMPPEATQCHRKMDLMEDTPRLGGKNEAEMVQLFAWMRGQVASIFLRGGPGLKR